MQQEMVGFILKNSIIHFQNFYIKVKNSVIFNIYQEQFRLYIVNLNFILKIKKKMHGFAKQQFKILFKKQKLLINIIL